MKQFIKIGCLYLNVADIIAVDANYEDEHFGVPTGVYYVRVVTRQLTCVDGNDGSAAVSVSHLFDIDSPEANAIQDWLEGQSEDLLR